MTKWMIPANPNKYDHEAAFQRGFIEWRQKGKYNVGDIVYIYRTNPIKKVMYKAIVEKESMSCDEIVDDREYWFDEEEYRKGLQGKFVRLRLLSTSDNDNLHLDLLMEHGLKGPPQHPIKTISPELSEYMDSFFCEYLEGEIFPESSIPEDCFEGAVQTVSVNRFERSSVARRNCIESNGTTCFVCGLNFEKRYGQIGKDFIHVHHIVPLNEIGKEYRVDYQKDLIPVCPNCHAMLHRKIGDRYYTWEELRDALKARG